MQDGGVHIGKLVKSVFSDSGMSVAELARQLHCERTNVYTIFRRRTIDVELLSRLSKILKHNFLADAMQLYGLSDTFRSQPNLTIRFDELTDEKVARLKEVLEELNSDS
ncbi:MAG: hypothetical protein IJT04_02320 [Bacteroidales bacterium]|nr:hypothetical protein [Bacteroidales bacterium]